MNKLLFVFCTALALVGCNRGGTGDQYNTGSGGGSSMSNQPAPANPAQGGANSGTSSNMDVNRPAGQQ